MENGSIVVTKGIKIIDKILMETFMKKPRELSRLFLKQIKQLLG